MTVFRKSLATLGLAAFLFSAVLVVSVLLFMNSLYYETNAERLKDTAKTLFLAAGEEYLRECFLSGGEPSGDNEKISHNAARFFMKGGAYRLTLIKPDGGVLWDSEVEGELVNHIDREEVRAALEGREGSARRDSISTGMRQIYFALPVSGGGVENGAVIGAFRLSLAVPRFWMRVAPAALPFLLFAALIGLAAFAAVFAFSRSLSGSLGRLVEIARTAAAQGGGGAEDAQRFAFSGEAGEFIALEKALRGMAACLTLRLEQARAEGQRLTAILNGMSGAVFATDEKLMLQLINPRARALFGLEESAPKNLSLLEATRSTELEETAKQALARGVSLETELILRSPQEQRFQVSAAPIAGCEGVVLVLEDVTRLVRLEQVRKDFVANVSHELRTPIQLIKGFSETLLERLPENPPADGRDQLVHCIGIIRKNAATMENLTNDLLILASLEDGDGGHEMEEQRLAPLFVEAVSSVEPQARRRQTEIIVECPAELTAKLHGLFIIQALINLLDNAIKYSPEKSKVWARAARENGHIVIEVQDTGTGIPAEHQQRIFERFYRVDKSRSRESGGTGLGLSIVRHIALLHRGSVEVESRPGAGSAFRLRLPL